MTLEQLRIFVAVAEREHVTAAALSLNLTQSATSAAIAALESRHAAKLFDRVGRRIMLTDAGRAFLPEARAVLADLAGLKSGHLAVGASQTVGNYVLPERIARFRAAYPGIALGVTIANTEAIAAGVAAGDIDLGLVEGEVDDPALAVTAIGADAMVLIRPAGHPATAKDGPTGAALAQINLAGTDLAGIDLAGIDWVARERGSGTRAAFDSFLDEHGVAPAARRVVLELPSNEAVCAAVAAGIGAAVLSAWVVAGAAESGRLTVHETGLPARPFYALRHRERYQSRAAVEFQRLLQDDGR